MGDSLGGGKLVGKLAPHYCAHSWGGVGLIGNELEGHCGGTCPTPIFVLTWDCSLAGLAPGMGGHKRVARIVAAAATATTTITSGTPAPAVLP